MNFNRERPAGARGLLGDRRHSKPLQFAFVSAQEVFVNVCLTEWKDGVDFFVAVAKCFHAFSEMI